MELTGPTVRLHCDGVELDAPQGTSVAAALLNAGFSSFRRSVAGESRAPLCGMGICFECRVSINGERHIRACLTTVQEGMEIETDWPGEQNQR